MLVLQLNSIQKRETKCDSYNFLFIVSYMKIKTLTDIMKNNSITITFYWGISIIGMTTVNILVNLSNAEVVSF